MSITLARGRQRQKDRKLKGILSYTASLRISWATLRGGQEKEEKGQEGEEEEEESATETMEFIGHVLRFTF